MDQFSDEVLTYIFKFLDNESLCNIGSICNKFYCIVNDKTLLNNKLSIYKQSYNVLQKLIDFNAKATVLDPIPNYIKLLNNYAAIYTTRNNAKCMSIYTKASVNIYTHKYFEPRYIVDDYYVVYDHKNIQLYHSQFNTIIKTIYLTKLQSKLDATLRRYNYNYCYFHSMLTNNIIAFNIQANIFCIVNLNNKDITIITVPNLRLWDDFQTNQWIYYHYVNLANNNFVPGCNYKCDNKLSDIHNLTTAYLYINNANKSVEYQVFTIENKYSGKIKKRNYNTIKLFNTLILLNTDNFTYIYNYMIDIFIKKITKIDLVDYNKNFIVFKEKIAIL